MVVVGAFVVVMMIRYRYRELDRLVIEEVPLVDYENNQDSSIRSIDVFGARRKVFSEHFSLGDRVESLMALNSLSSFRER